MSIKTNLRVLKRTRANPAPGDVFAMLLPDEDYLFGRVILADLPSSRAPMPTANLVYIYDVRETAKSPPLDLLKPQRLLIAPQFINRMPWSKGYFENVALRPLQESDVLQQHCFWDPLRKVFRDEAGEVVGRRTEPCGVWGLGSYRMIDDLISDALGIKRVPE
ncbi:MAG: immunity 26/phosphotriesterase HocA family protein [Chloroflexota bacterium]|nr:immunity 26/phosphotriesterase HocA family protein [Chloroflexota bacterium]